MLPDVAGKDVRRARLRHRVLLRLARPPRRAGRPASTSRRRSSRRRAQMQREFGLEFPLLEADADETCRCRTARSISSSPSTAPRSGVDPYRWIPEAARLLRPGGELVFLRNSTLVILCVASTATSRRRAARAAAVRPAPLRLVGGRPSSSTSPTATGSALLRANGFDDPRPRRAPGAGARHRRTRTTTSSPPTGRGSGRPRRSGGRASGELARRRRRSCSPRRARSGARSSSSSGSRSTSSRPTYVEHDPPDADAVELVREHARGKARSVAAQAGDRPVLGVDTAVSLGGRIFGKPANATDAERMLEELAGETHVVVSGLCLLTPGWELVEHDDDARHLPRADAARARASPGARRVGGTRRRLRDPGPRRRARRADRGRLPERRRPARGAARPPRSPSASPAPTASARCGRTSASQPRSGRRRRSVRKSFADGVTR